MQPPAPSPVLMFVIMFVLVTLFVGAVILFGGLSRVLRGESFWPREDGSIRRVPSSGRSTAFKKKFSRANAVQARSGRANAENPNVQNVQTFADRSNVQPFVSTLAPDLPASVDELQRLAHTIALYAKRPNKELAILEAWGETKGDGDGYKRASQLFDSAMSDAAKSAAKAKIPPAALREVETA